MAGGSHALQVKMYTFLKKNILNALPDRGYICSGHEDPVMKKADRQTDTSQAAIYFNENLHN